MNNLKKLLIKNLTDESYPKKEAKKDVENADIRIKGNDVTVFWEGGNLNRYTYTKSKLVIYD